MFQDLIVTPILTLILYSILYRMFFKKEKGELKSSNTGYVLVAESFQECMKKKEGITPKSTTLATKRTDDDEKKDLAPNPATLVELWKEEENEAPNGKEDHQEKKTEKGKIEKRGEDSHTSSDAANDSSIIDEGGIHIPETRAKKQKNDN
eukprot:CAMPEP_0114589542 /NCGR_PEP_ID=MMETSP0125-20121206/11965_1 /TAXON_ID=485358 ORGANISM="Aristerostoma sp., Strain ATCC 50986" /NCGR_SAMPLE_ID=MMETSP0125 /ASSEMBLY_ACC=CAM_ASM_000245 /LENGTH=149 /DNA_ID=CAMNT_0001786483 /DNA_START=1304 /DNA_END=1753 /DNA_ORIENTATION=+